MQKYRILIFLTICAVFIISGCRNTGTGNDNKYPDSTEFEEEDDDDETGTDSHELSLYTIDYETYECTPTVSVISEKSEINAKLIINEVIANFTENVVIEDVVENSDNIIVYFSDDAAPVKNVSEKMEYAMLDCIAYSLLDNLDYCNEVYFRSNDEIYESKYIYMNHDEPYISK